MDPQARLGAIKLLICDVDGVLTDGRIVLDTQGNELKFFDVRDGHGLALLMRAGIGVGLLTGRTGEVVARRAKELGIRQVVQGSRDKGADLSRLAEEAGCGLQEVAYIGDDLVDLPALRLSGFAAAPADAHAGVLPHVHHVTLAKGGRGAVREVSDMILKARGLWEPMMNSFLDA